MNRRKLISQSFLGLAAGAMSANAVHAAPQKMTNGIRTETYDVVVIGCGCAGLSCAIEAADKGARVAVLEKQPIPLGNTIFAGGNFNATNTWVQKRDGITDTIEAFYKDMMAVSLNRADPVLTRIFCEESAGVVQWLTDRCHMIWKPIDLQIAPMLGRCREVGGEMKPGGAQLLKNMMQEAEKAGVDLVFDTKAVELIHDDMLSCKGVKTVGEDGPVNYMAKGGVVICTGGFHNNKDMVTRYMGGDVAWMPLRGSTCLTGENVMLTAPFFTQNVNMDQYHCGPIHAATRANPSGMVNWGICVNPQGERYVDENNTYVSVARVTPKRIRENRAFIVIDSRVLSNPIVDVRIQRYKRARAPIFQGNTIEELAKQAGLPADKLAKTVKEFNKAVNAGKGAQLAVPYTMKAPHTIEKAPFYAVEFSGGITATFGGPKISPKAELLNTENKPIPGLYGAGNAVGGIFYEDYLTGSQLTAAVIWGRIAARECVVRSKNG